jgi:hypothetical protein
LFGQGVNGEEKSFTILTSGQSSVPGRGSYSQFDPIEVTIFAAKAFLSNLTFLQIFFLKYCQLKESCGTSCTCIKLCKAPADVVKNLRL